MNRLKLFRFLFALFIVLTVIFAVLLIVLNYRDNVLGIIGLWGGFISMLIDAVVVYTEIRKIKKGQDS